jgi:uncharacterized phage infection (PIP) family protein YhgE
MGTDNRRVATYLPKEIDDRLKAFILERNLKGDSPALIVILSEYFGIDTQVAQKVDYSGFVRTEQFEELVARVGELSDQINKDSSDGGLLSKLPNKMRQIAERLEKVEAFTVLAPFAESEPTSELSGAVPGQMDLLELSEPVKANSDSLNSLNGELKLEEPHTQKNESPNNKNESSENGIKSRSVSELQPLKGIVLAIRLKVNPQSLSNNKAKWSNEKFIAWTREKDPDEVGWLFEPEDRLYHPAIDSLLVSFSSSPI